MTRSRTLRRDWRFPDLRNGSRTLHHITDTHFGGHSQAQWALDWGLDVERDLDDLSVYLNAGHVMTGDMIHMYYAPTQNSEATYDQQVQWYLDFRSAVQADGLPWAECPGNHDMIGWGPDSDGLGGSGRTPVTGQRWADDFGWPSVNNAVDMGDFKVVTVGPDLWVDNTDYVLSAATLSWLDAQLQSAGKPCWVATHVPFNEQMNTSQGGGASLEPGNPTLLDVFDANPSVIGHLSGHRHVDITTTPLHASVFSVGSRNVFGINGPSCIGGFKGGVITDADAQWKAWNQSIFITILDDGPDATIDVRWRDHNARRWTNPPGETHRLLNLDNPTPDPVGFGFSPFGLSPFGGLSAPPAEGGFGVQSFGTSPFGG